MPPANPQNKRQILSENEPNDADENRLHFLVMSSINHYAVNSTVPSSATTVMQEENTAVLCRPNCRACMSSNASRWATHVQLLPNSHSKRPEGVETKLTSRAWLSNANGLKQEQGLGPRS